MAKVLFGNAYTIGFAYNQASELTQITYPSGRVVQQSYDPVGNLCAVATNTSNCGSYSGPFAYGFAYNAADQPTGFTYGNGVNAAFGYSPTTSQLSSLSYTKGSSTIFSLNYWYQQNSTYCPGGTAGNDGQINCITDNKETGRSVAYSYDALGRIASALTTGSANYPRWGLAWSYDRYGNRTAQSVTAGSAPSSSLAFNTSTNQPVGYTFDASGNMTIEGSNHYAYDAQDRMTGVSGGASATYAYDGDDLRVKKAVSGGTSTVYVFLGEQDIAEYDNGAGVASPTREYIYGNGSLISTISASGTV